jgi:hypothetical protein
MVLLVVSEWMLHQCSRSAILVGSLRESTEECPLAEQFWQCPSCAKQYVSPLTVSGVKCPTEYHNNAKGIPAKLAVWMSEVAPFEVPKKKPAVRKIPRS